MPIDLGVRLSVCAPYFEAEKFSPSINSIPISCLGVLVQDNFWREICLEANRSQTKEWK